MLASVPPQNGGTMAGPAIIWRRETIFQNKRRKGSHQLLMIHRMMVKSRDYHAQKNKIVKFQHFQKQLKIIIVKLPINYQIIQQCGFTILPTLIEKIISGYLLEDRLHTHLLHLLHGNQGARLIHRQRTFAQLRQHKQDKMDCFQEVRLFKGKTY